jgi:hypothetical protein
LSSNFAGGNTALNNTEICSRNSAYIQRAHATVIVRW